MAETQLPIVAQDPTDPAFVQDPYGFYRRLRALGSFVFWKEYDRSFATTQAAVAQVLKHPKLGRAVPEEMRDPVPRNLMPFYEIEQHSLLELEGPDHARIRRRFWPRIDGDDRADCKQDRRQSDRPLSLQRAIRSADCLFAAAHSAGDHTVSRA